MVAVSHCCGKRSVEARKGELGAAFRRSTNLGDFARKSKKNSHFWPKQGVFGGLFYRINDRILF
jgi:hypothetical protein